MNCSLNLPYHLEPVAQFVEYNDLDWLPDLVVLPLKNYGVILQG